MLERPCRELLISQTEEEPLRFDASAVVDEIHVGETPFSTASHERAMAMKPTSEM